ncbi:MAG: hypothetical protein J6T33_11185 [Bacteroidales bacterium]|nr:hypothetical protein [Bacteroidales bacterium]
MEENIVPQNLDTVPAQQESDKELLATSKTSMVLGIVSVGACTVGDPAAIVVSIIGLVKAKKAKKLAATSNDRSCDKYISVGRTTSTIGLVLGIVLAVGLVLYFLFWFLLVFYMAWY